MDNPDTVFRSADGRVEIYRRPDGSYGVMTRTRPNSLNEVQATIGYLSREELDDLMGHLVHESFHNFIYYKDGREATPEITA